MSQGCLVSFLCVYMRARIQSGVWKERGADDAEARVCGVCRCALRNGECDTLALTAVITALMCGPQGRCAFERLHVSHKGRCLESSRHVLT